MLIPVHFTVAGQFPFNNTYNASGTGANGNPAIQPGNLVQVVDDGTGTVTPTVALATASSPIVGVAGDAFRSDLPATASGYAADIVVNANGDTTRSQNRISDLYKETLASGLMTVYSGSGTFRTNVYAAVTFAYGDALKSDANGNITNTGSGPTIGHVVGLPKAFPNGVPGTDVAGSMTLGTFLTFTLNV